MINYNCKHSGLIDSIAAAGHRLIRVNNRWVSSDDVAVQNIIDNFDHVSYIRQEAKERVRRQAEEIMISVEQSYPSFEIQTWPYQRLEVEAWDVDNDAPTPTIDAIALSKGADRIAQLNRTLAKVTEFKNTSNHLVGRRQYFEDLIDNSTDIDYIASLNFEA